MAIDINPLSSGLGQIAQGSPAERSADGKGGTDPQSRPAAGGDQVTLTPEARQLKALEEKVSDLPVVDTDRVNAVRTALANGSYEIDTQRIASKLMSLERALSDLS